MICSIDAYYRNRQKLCVDEAFEYARSIKSRLGRMPAPSDFWEEFPLFVDSHNINDYPDIPIRRQLMNDAIIHSGWKIIKRYSLLLMHLSKLHSKMYYEIEAMNIQIDNK